MRLARSKTGAKYGETMQGVLPFDLSGVLTGPPVVPSADAAVETSPACPTSTPDTDKSSLPTDGRNLEHSLGETKQDVAGVGAPRLTRTALLQLLTVLRRLDAKKRQASEAARQDEPRDAGRDTPHA